MSDELNFPERLVPKKDGGDEALAVDLQATVDYSPEHVDRMAKELGLARLTGARLKMLRDLGLSVEQLGVLRMLKGGIAISSDTTLQVMEKLNEIIHDPKSKPKEIKEAASVLATLVNTYTRLAVGSTKIDKDVAEVVMQRDEQVRNSFRPGIRHNVATVIPT